MEMGNEIALKPVRLASDSADTMARSTMVEPARTASTSLRRSRGDRCAVPAASSGRSLGFSHMNQKARPSTSGAAVGHEMFFTQMGVLTPFHVAFENEGWSHLKMYETKMWQAR